MGEFGTGSNGGQEAKIEEIKFQPSDQELMRNSSHSQQDQEFAFWGGLGFLSIEGQLFAPIYH